jgi:hypothetical protein
MVHIRSELVIDVVIDGLSLKEAEKRVQPKVSAHF